MNIKLISKIAANAPIPLGIKEENQPLPRKQGHLCQAVLQVQSHL